MHTQEKKGTIQARFSSWHLITIFCVPDKQRKCIYMYIETTKGKLANHDYSLCMCIIHVMSIINVSFILVGGDVP